MPRPPRHCDPDTYYMLTNRTERAQFLLRPDDGCRKIVLGCLAKWAHRLDVEVVCFCILSNHFHIIARFPNRKMDRFMEQFSSMVARRLKKYRGFDGEHFWGRRYDDTPILDDQELEEKIAYVVNNAVQHRLVTRADRWPGICSIDWHKSGQPVEGKWLNKTERSRLRRQGKPNAEQRARETYRFELTLPEALGADEEERRQNLLELVEQDRKRLQKERRRDRGGVTGRRSILRTDWRHIPDDPAEAPTPLCFASDPEVRQKYRKKRRRVTDKYRRAVASWRDKEVAKFPVGTYPPGWKRCIDTQEYRAPPDTE